MFRFLKWTDLKTYWNLQPMLSNRAYAKKANDINYEDIISIEATVE